MRSFSRAIVVIAGLVALGAAAGGSSVIANQAAPLIYPPGDAVKDINAALAAALKDGKHVLLDFGADWCPDCRVLGALFEDPAVAPFAAANFHVVHIDVGRRDKNADVVAKYSATSADWIPAVVVLDANGKTVAVTDDKVRLTRRTTPQQLLALLKDWAPKTTWLELASFTERGVTVRLALDRDSSGGAWLAGTFTPVEADTHLYAKDLPLDGINGLGRPIRLELPSDSGIRLRGGAVANRPVKEDRLELLNTTLPIYPDGEVTLRLPIDLDVRASERRAEILVSYMACGPKGCLPPVKARRVTVVLPRSTR
jgi:thioredoxin 1